MSARKVIRQIEVTVESCDVCNTDLEQRYFCRMCRRLLCSKCVHWNFRSDSFADVYCHPCWSAGEPFREKLRLEQERFDKAEEAIELEWKKAAEAERQAGRQE